VVVRTSDVVLDGDLVLPSDPLGLVIFVHGSGSGRKSPRNRSVAAALQGAGLATLLFDLLTPVEERRDRATGELRFDIDFLAQRLIGATAWARTHERVGKLPFGYFGASTGAAAALVAAATTREVSAVVSRGGRPDLADEMLALVRAPSLLIVGGNDAPVVTLNRRAFTRLRCEKRLVVVPGAGHLFEEPGALREVARLATSWLVGHLAPHRVAA
jgi:pimeloyl-ACP methyl ester carboxylesterase